MDKNDIAWLIKDNEPLHFIVTPTQETDTWHLQVCHDDKTTPMTTTSGIVREYRSISRFICGELGRGFEARYPPSQANTIAI